MKKTLFASVLAVTIPLAAAAAELQTTSGTMQLGGSVSLTPNVLMPEQGSNSTSFSFTFAPNVGYFVIDNLELTGGVGAVVFFGDNTDNLPKLVGFDLGARYLLPLGSLAPYFGLSLGMGFTIPSQGDTFKTFRINAPLGLLFALNQHVAIDVGLRVRFSIGLDDQGNQLLLPIGYLGLQAFF